MNAERYVQFARVLRVLMTADRVTGRDERMHTHIGDTARAFELVNRTAPAQVEPVEGWTLGGLVDALCCYRPTAVAALAEFEEHADGAMVELLTWLQGLVRHERVQAAQWGMGGRPRKTTPEQLLHDVERRVITPGEAIARSGVSRATLYRRLRERRLARELVTA